MSKEIHIGDGRLDTSPPVYIPMSGNATRYNEGDAVDTPDGLGVVVEVRTEDFDGPDGAVEASDSSPAYVVGLEDGDVGAAVYRASDLEATDLPDTGVDDPVEDAADQAANAAEPPDADAAIAIPLTANDWTMPASWRKSPKPARLILLDAWSSMGGQFDCGGGCCMGEMMTSGLSRRRAAQFCASMKDEALGGWEGWRR